VGATLRREFDNVYRMDVTGLLRRGDFATIEQDAAATIREHGAIRLLVVLDGFTGWEPGGSWQDLGFYVHHGDDIERIAIVGDEKWRSEALLFAAADLRRAAVEYFRAADLPRAMAWLSE
jgi:hypothetical protein